jgi:DNA-directed RNA polymerase I subunit RPA1
MNISKPVGSEITEVEFGYFTARDIKNLSVKQITHPQVFDSLGHPISGGLYDLALGAYDKIPYVSKYNNIEV